MFHRFDDEFDGEPFAVHCTRFDYDETPYISQLAEVTQIGLRREVSGYSHKAMPPLTLGYTKPRALDGTAIAFKPLTIAHADGMPDRLFRQPIDELVDLYGDGLPGILYSDDQTTLYWRALGDGRFQRALASKPLPCRPGSAHRSIGANRSRGRRQTRPGGAFPRSQWFLPRPFRRQLGCLPQLCSLP